MVRPRDDNLRLRAGHDQKKEHADMIGRVAGKVALITGAARGQGRSHAVRLAEEGADIIALDLCEQIESAPYTLGTEDDLAQTVKEVESLGRRIVAARVDVRADDELKSAVDRGVQELGRLDIVSANAGITSMSRLEDMPEQAWQDVIDVNLTGVWHTAKATIKHLRAAGGGSMILTNSVCGLKGMPNIGHYVAAKHGLVGLMRALASELGTDKIRVNCVHPSGVDTDMIHNEPTYALFAPDLEPSERTREEVGRRFGRSNVLQLPWVEARDVSNAVLWLASDESRYVTGVSLPVDAGHSSR
jgi:(+)-trans-carveol dehydrogenase